MANLIKPKIFTTIVSIGLTILLYSIDKNFYEHNIQKRWEEPLNWNDFTGKVDPFSQYDASVASSVYLEFDSISKIFKAYAAQINVISWARESERSDDLLNHEQYHFNITEYHARLMNKYISENPTENKDYFQAELKNILSDANDMQKKYDEETTHSLQHDQQRLWEYKIDSLLTLNSIDSGWVSDSKSGATIFFPSKASLRTGLTNSKIPFRIYSIEKSDLIFLFASLQIPELKSDSIIKYLEKSYSVISSKKLTITQEGSKIKLIGEDSLGKKINLISMYQEPYLISAGIYYNDLDTIGYTKIFKSFTNTLKFLKTESSTSK
jgi:hypothetical protein